MYTIEDAKIGDSFELEVLITETDVADFAKVSGDASPIHMDEEYAKNTKFKKRIVHGMLLGSYISRVIGMHLPGAGTIYETQDLHFIKPVYIGEQVFVKVEVKEIRKEKKRLILKTECFNNEKELVLTGEAVVLPARVKL